MIDASTPLCGRRVWLRPLEPTDVAELRRRELDADIAFRWRHHGSHDPPDVYSSRLWGDSLFQFIVSLGDQGQMDGLITAYQPDPANGTVYLGAVRFSQGGAISFIGALALSVDYVFFGWPIRKIYFESPGFSLKTFQSAVGRVFVEEGRLTEHVYLGGRYWDLHILALWRERWGEVRERYLALA